MTKYSEVFKRKPIIGMVHLEPLPGSPKYAGSMNKIIDAAMEDLHALQEGGADAFIIENFGDEPYALSVDTMTFAAMTRVASAVAAEAKIPFGVNVQFNCTEEEYAMSYALGANFVRVEAFVENRVSGSGVMYAAAPQIMRMKGQYPSDTMIFADINTKHTFPLVETPIDLTIHEAIAAGADALIITGLLTGQSPKKEDLVEVKKFTHDTPVLLGSGVSIDNAKDLFSVADGAIIGSSIKRNGNVYDRVDAERLKRLVEVVHG